MEELAKRDTVKNDRSFREMLNTLPVAIYATDDEGCLTYFNQAAAEFSGREPELGTDKWCVTWKLYHPDGKPMPHDACPMAASLKKGHNISGEAIAERPDGKRIWFRAYPSLIYDDEGNITSAVNMLVDISKQKQMEEALDKNEESNALLAAIIKDSDDAIISKTLDGDVTSWNSSAERMFGYTKQEAVGQNITIIIPDDRLDEETEILKTLRNGGKIDHFETIRERKDGAKLDISLTISPVKDASGHIIGASKIARNITERKRNEEKLKEINETLEDRVEKRTSALLSYQKQLRSLAEQLSKAEEKERRRLATHLHDNLGQILTACKMEVDLIQKTGNLSNINKASDLLNDAISHTRRLMSNLKPPPSLGKGDISATIHWVAKKMKRYDLNVIFNRKESPPKALDEDVQITIVQCLRELLFNVVKHANTNEACIQLSYADNKIKIVVVDDGDGFDIGQAELDLSKDSGFGLFNIRERIDMLGGRTDIVSKPGEGTKISLTVPIEGQNTGISGKQKLKRTSQQAKEHQREIKILLVDDHEVMRKGLKRIIEGENDLRVIAEAANAGNIVRRVRRAKPEVIIMDVNLPGINGITATQKIKAKLPDMHIIGLSLYDDKEVEENMRSVGAEAYLSKTEAFETLCATIRSVAGT